MSDYTKTTNFTAKDNLTTGNALKVIKGSYFDTEFDAIAVASATKYDSGNLASQTQAEDLTVDTVLITPHSLNDVLVDNGGIAKDLQQLAAPGADNVLCYDFGTTSAKGFTLGAGLEFSGDTINLKDAVAGAGLAVASSILSVNADQGVKIESDTVRLSDVAAGATQPVVVTDGTFTFDLSSITEITGPNLDQAADGFLVNNGGAINVLPIDQAGVKVVTADAIQTFAITDANTMQVLSGTTERIWTIPTNASVGFEIGTAIICQNSGTADIVITAIAGVVLDSKFHTTAADAQSDHIVPGGMAVLIKTATNTWALAGDIEDT
jgi:hypothetical protein